MVLEPLPAQDIQIFRHISSIIEKAKCISNTVIDAGETGITIASILTHLEKFEENWEKYPKSAFEIQAIAADKVTRHLPKYTKSTTPYVNLNARVSVTIIGKAF